MSKVKEVTLKALTNIALSNAKKEADSACLFLGYQPHMPKEVREISKKNRK